MFARFCGDPPACTEFTMSRYAPGLPPESCCDALIVPPGPEVNVISSQSGSLNVPSKNVTSARPDTTQMTMHSMVRMVNERPILRGAERGDVFLVMVSSSLCLAHDTSSIKTGR